MTTALAFIALIVLATWTTIAAVRTDRPKTAPRSHADDPAFEPMSSLPTVRWP
ncbi:MAG: hypothetical protein ACRDPS_25315 [Nocardioides sp.]|uniref:hypothetical protein n=1 Tax=Nocardioides sp. TaxID=35761 RepID=UPI003D6A8547